MGRESEQFLLRLCQKSFLSLWAIPNPFNDKGLSQRREGKELCDLLVVFGDDVIIFSDKSCEYPNTGDESLDWSRWYRKAITKSIEQVRGAERWLREHPQRVFLDGRCELPLHVSLPPPERMRIHRVVVALGAGDRCRKFFGGGSGSLPISGGGPSDESSDDNRPFYIRSEAADGSFVHVFDDVTLEIVLTELDTITDFTEYLRKKEELFRSHHVIATGEEDLLAQYLSTTEGEKHVFLQNGSQFTGLFVDESSYATLIRRPEYAERKRANIPSYTWDRLIEYFVDKWRKGLLVQDENATLFEQSVRAMATVGRLMRRSLGRMIAATLDTNPGVVRYIGTMDYRSPDIAYGAVWAPREGAPDRDSYREFRKNLMIIYGRSLRIRFPGIKKAVILGIGPKFDKEASEDLLLLDFADWSPEFEEAAIKDMEMLGLSAEPQHFRDQEFPESAHQIRAPATREAARRMRQLARLKQGK